MSERIDFSIIIPTRNRPRQLAVCLEALGNLDYFRSRFEVIVIDDGSSPPIEPIASAFCDRLDLKVWRQQNGGPASARNRGAKKAVGRYLAFTDDDCVPRNDWMKKLAARFGSLPDCIIGGRTINTLPDNVYSSASQDLIDYLYEYYNADHHNAVFFTSNNMSIRADHFRSLGGFDSGFPRAAAEDRNLCDRCRLQGFKMVYAPEIIVYHKHHLSLGTFWRQHFCYGTGAFRFHKLRSRRVNGKFKFERFTFYTNLIRYPFLKRKKRRAFFISTLFCLSQAGNAAGFFWEWFKSLNHARCFNSKT
jgi:glycosyltransferase involved in cell wall biosynthesis